VFFKEGMALYIFLVDEVVLSSGVDKGSDSHRG
jgi:hypothetical protein